MDIMFLKDCTCFEIYIEISGINCHLKRCLQNLRVKSYKVKEPDISSCKESFARSNDTWHCNINCFILIRDWNGIILYKYYNKSQNTKLWWTWIMDKGDTISICLTLQEGASGMDIKKGGLLNPAPIKTHLKALLAWCFGIGRVGG